MKIFQIKEIIRENQQYAKFFRPLRIKLKELGKIIKYLKYVTDYEVRTVVSLSKFHGDGFITRNYIGGFSNKKLDLAWSESLKDLPKDIKKWVSDIKYRAHICTWAAKQVQNVEGDFVELGVFYGHLSKVIINYAPETLNGRNFYLVDPWGNLGDQAFSNYLYNKDIFEVVKSRFVSNKQVQLVRGTVPRVLPSIPSENVALLLIDMNGHEAELEALKYFYPKMSKGGIIYFDDYGGRWPKLREVVDEFLSDKQEELLTFASPNAIMIKK
jgi:O-methyltransferase